MGCACSKENVVDAQVVSPVKPAIKAVTGNGAGGALPPADVAPTSRSDSAVSLDSIYQDAASQADSVDSFLTAFCNTPSSHSESEELDAFLEAFDAHHHALPSQQQQQLPQPQQRQQQHQQPPVQRLNLPNGGHRHAPGSRAAFVEAAAAVGQGPAECVLRQYKQGDIMLCKAVGELIAYWKASGVALDQLESQLLAAEARIDEEARREQQQQQRGEQQHGEQRTEQSVEQRCEQQQQSWQYQHQAHTRDEQQRRTRSCTGGGVSCGGASCCGASCGGGAGARPPRRRRRFISTSGDALLPGAKPLGPAGLGCGGSDLFSAAHVMAHVRTTAELLRQLEESKGWRQVAFGALRTWHHHDRGTGLQHFKVHCVIEEPMLNVVCLCREVDLVTTWNPTLNAMKCMLQASLAELLVYMGLWVPWPLTQPAILIRALGMDLLRSEGAVIVSMQDLGDALPPGLELVAGHEARKRYALHPSCFRFEPLPPAYPGGPPRVDTTVIATLDANRVPVNDTVISFLLKVFAPVVYRTVVSTCHRLFHKTPAEESPLERRMRERADLYLPQALSIDKYLKAKGWEEQLPQIRGLRGVQLPQEQLPQQVEEVCGCAGAGVAGSA